MDTSIYSVITGTGKYIPTERIRNEDFLAFEFYDNQGVRMNRTNREIIAKFEEITTIEERRYVNDNLVTSDIAYFAALDALETTGVEKESLDYIIVAHNFGDVKFGNGGVDIVPSLAARVKHKLKIVNPDTIAYDLPFGCPGWLQAMIQADYYIKAGDAGRALVIGAEILSRVSDRHDRDTMLYADGAGAAILEGRRTQTPSGILAHKTRSDTYLYSQMLYMGKSNNPAAGEKAQSYLKMNGRKLYQYALEVVPTAIKACLDKSRIHLRDIRKILIHQANGKMDDAIIRRLYALYGMEAVPDDIMPMTISWLGNSSVATLPTLLDMILKGGMEAHRIEAGDKLVFASVGAGMNINAMVYQA